MTEKKTSNSNQAVKEIIAGSIGGLFQVLNGQPFDTIKVRLQTQPTPPLYSGFMDCVRKTIQADGVRGLYKGTLTPLIGIGACVSIQFGTLEQTKRLLIGSSKSKDLSWIQLFIAGASSGVANSVISGPVEHIRTRLQVQSGSNLQYRGSLDCLKQIYSRYGINGVFKGQAITVVREFQGYGMYFLTYESLVQRKCAAEGLSRSELSIWNVMTYGALAGYSLWFYVFPIDLIKSKLQTDELNPSLRKYKSALDCFQQVMKSEGISGLYRGFVPCILRAGPVNAVTFIGFELAMSMMSRD